MHRAGVMYEKTRSSMRWKMHSSIKLVRITHETKKSGTKVMRNYA